MDRPRGLFDVQYLDIKVYVRRLSSARAGTSAIAAGADVTYGYVVPDHAPFDPIAEAHRQWSTRWPEHADHMAAVTSVMRVQQLLLARVEDILKPYGLTFALYEALRLLAFSRTGSLPMGKMGERLMVHPAAVTNAIGKLEQRGLVQRNMSSADRRIVLATISPAGRALADEATDALNQAEFGLVGFTPGQAAELTEGLRGVRALVGDIDLDRDRVLSPPGCSPLPRSGGPATGRRAASTRHRSSRCTRGNGRAGPGCRGKGT